MFPKNLPKITMGIWTAMM